jgi:hypothetical protein
MTILREEVPQVVINALIFGCRLSLGDVLLSTKRTAQIRCPRPANVRERKKDQ